MSIEVKDDLVRHIARLARLGIKDADVPGFKSHFEKILEFISSFQALDTRDVDPSLFSVEASSVYREDQPRPSLPRAEFLAAAPESEGVYFIVPRIVGDPDAGGGGAGPTGTDAPGEGA